MSRGKKSKQNRASRNQETQDFFKELLLMPQDFWNVASNQIGDNTVFNLFNDIYSGKEDIENLPNYQKALNKEFTAEKISKLRDIEQNYEPYTKEEIQNNLKSQREVYLASHPELAAAKEESIGSQDRGGQPAAPTTGGQPASTEKLTNLQKQFREKFPLKSEPKSEPSKPVKAGFFSEKASILNFDENFSLTDARKRQLLKTKWNKTLDEISPGAKQYTDKSMKRAMEKFSKDYNLNVDLSDYKTSMLGRIANRIRGNKNISKEEALERTLGAYSKKTNEYINSLKEQYQSGKITDRQYMRRANRGWTRATANGGQRVKNHGKLGWKGKAGAAAALLALGGVIGNQFSGGHQSNAQLYNPNPQPQYAN